MTLLEESLPKELNSRGSAALTQETPAVTIIIVTWNRKEELIKCLHSLERQRLHWSSRAELIVIDDGSSDGTADFLRRYRWPFGRYRAWRTPTNQGPGLARNLALHHASASFVFFIDTDCWLQTEDALWRLQIELQQNPTLEVAAPCIWNDAQRTQPPFLLGGYLTRTYHADLPRWRSEMDEPHFLSTCCSIWRKESILNVGGFDPYYGHGIEDADLCLRVVRSGGKLKVVCGVHAVHEMSSQGRKRHPKDFRRVYQYLERTRPYLYLKIHGIRKSIREFARWPLAGKDWWYAYGRDLTVWQKLWGRVISPACHLAMYPIHRLKWSRSHHLTLPRQAELITDIKDGALLTAPADPALSSQTAATYETPELYDHSYFAHDPEEEIFWLRCAEKAGGIAAKVMEIGAGTGRLALPLARVGMHVTALDNSQAMLDVLLSKAQAEFLPITAVNGDIRCLECRDDSFDFIFGALGIGSLLPSVDEAADFFRRISRLLRPGGRLALHVCLTHDPHAPSHHEGTWTAGTHFVQTRSWFSYESLQDPSLAHYEYRILALQGDETKLLVHRGQMRLFHADFIRDALRAAPEMEFVEWSLPYSHSQTFQNPPRDTISAILTLQRRHANSSVFLAGFREPTDTPVQFVAASGCQLVDASGQTYLDFSSQYVNVNLGHHHPGLMSKFHDAADRHLFINLRFGETESQAKLAAALLERTRENYSGVQFTASGSMAIEAAIKIVRQVTGRQKILSFRQSYHGMSYGALSSTGYDEIVLPFGARDGRHILVHPPRCSLCPYGRQRETCGLHCASEVVKTIDEHGRSIAAIVSEPVISNQVIVPPDGFWPEIVRACRRHGILIVADEVVSGFGRCGDWNGSQRVGLEPDILVLGKGMTAGLVPFAAVLHSPEITSYYRGKTLLHGQTFDGYDLGCRTALAVIATMEEEAIIERLPLLELHLSSRLTRLADEFPAIHSVRGWGLLWAMELSPAALPEAQVHSFATSLQARLMRHGLLLGGLGRVLIFAPPFIVTEAHIDDAIGILRSCLADELSSRRR